MEVGILLSVREKASRLPGKVIKHLYDMNVTEHLLYRLKMAKLASKVIISTSTDSRDDVFEIIAKDMDVDIYRGSEDDKLLRYYDTAKEFGLDAVVVVDGDDLLCFPEFIDETIQKMQSDDSIDVVFTKNLPLGAASSGLKVSALEKVLEIKDENDTEVWGGYFTTTNHFNVQYVEAEGIFNNPDIRMTLDYEEDFEFFRTIFETLYLKDKNFSSKNVMELLTQIDRSICDINKEAQIKYENHISGAAEVKFKEGVE
jgi:spore coat polysaccharide biosynthesis protein SpsF (cytidylyltransferase family)